MNCARQIALAALALALWAPAAAQADFGIVPGSVSIAAVNKDGTPDTLAGSHPAAVSVHFTLNATPSGEPDGGAARDAIIDLPAGLIGNPAAVPTCPSKDLQGAIPVCPPASQVGEIEPTLPFLGTVHLPLYNMVPAPGVVTEFGFSYAGVGALQFASVRERDGYRVRFEAPDLPIEVTAATATVWGFPPDPSHDALRLCHSPTGVVIEGCSSDAPFTPYLSLPASCQAPPQADFALDSKLAPGLFSEESATLLDPAGKAASLGGCDAVPFSPGVSAQPTTKLASNPSGLDFELKLPDQGLLIPGGTTETEPRKTVVTLPQGVTVNPAFAEGASVCSEEQYEAEQAKAKAGRGCPEASKLGSVIAQTPLLEEPIEGSLYLAAPYENPFGTLAAIYLVARAPERGILVKQAGKVEFDSSTGQITTTFDNLPPVPYSDFKLHFREGARAPLATPTACGEYQTVAKLTPFSAADDTGAVTRTASFQIERGADGGPCPSGGLPPFHPGLIAGSINNAAGRFSPFNVRLSRNDTEQEISHFSIKLPPGIVGKLAGIPFCPEAAIAAAKARTGPHGGLEEIEHPSCPAASQIGRSLAGSGVGSALAYAPGNLYLAGPYHGSALSLVSITSAKVGPFDLGTVVIRFAFKINPETAEVFLDATGSDPIPHIIQGVPVHLRDISASTDRPEFVLNPTSCKQTSTASTLLGSGLNFASEADDNPITVTTPFQAVNCSKLPYGPKLKLRLIGGAKRNAHPALRAELTTKPGEANTASSVVTLPHSEFLEQAHIKTVCTRVQFREATCPAGSIYGHASATTPLLSEPLEGPVYLRSSEHKLPDLVAVLKNGEIEIDLVGRIDSVKGGGIRTSFEAAPDAPVSKFVLSMEGGSKGLLVNSTALCGKPHRADIEMAGHNGKHFDSTPALKVKCGGKGKKRVRRHHGGGHR